MNRVFQCLPVFFGSRENSVPAVAHTITVQIAVSTDLVTIKELMIEQMDGILLTEDTVRVQIAANMTSLIFHFCLSALVMVSHNLTDTIDSSLMGSIKKIIMDTNRNCGILDFSNDLGGTSCGKYLQNQR